MREVIRKSARALIAVAFLAINIIPNGAHATKGGPTLPVQMTVSKAVVKPGETFTYNVTSKNGATKATGVMVGMELMPAEVECTQIVRGNACQLKAPNGVLSCMPNELPPYGTLDIIVSCQVKATATCGKALNYQVGLWANKNDARAIARQTVKCDPTPAPTSTFTPQPTSTFTPRPTMTSTSVPTRTPTKVPSSTPTITIRNTPYPTATRTPVRTPTRTPARTECCDGIDNDGDGDIDYPDDQGCSSASDDSEDTQQLKVTKTVKSTVKPGELVKYSYRVTNLGNRQAIGIDVDDFNINSHTGEPIEQQFKYVKADNASCEHSDDDQVVYCGIGNLLPNQSRDFALYFRVPSGTSQCNLDVTNQVDVYESSEDCDFINYAKATTRVRCEQTTCTPRPYYCRSGGHFLNAILQSKDPAEQQAARIVRRYGLVANGPFTRNVGLTRGYSGFYWYQSKYFSRGNNKGWVYLDPKTNTFRLSTSNNYSSPEDDTFIAQIGGLDACGVCYGDGSSCQP